MPGKKRNQILIEKRRRKESRMKEDPNSKSRYALKRRGTVAISPRLKKVWCAGCFCKMCICAVLIEEKNRRRKRKQMVY